MYARVYLFQKWPFAFLFNLGSISLTLEFVEMMADDACTNRSGIHFKKVLFLDYGFIFSNMNKMATSSLLYHN